MSRRLSFALSSIVIVYMLTLGGTYAGMLLPNVRLLSVAGLVGLVVVWLVVRRGGRWHAAPLDAAFGLWALAIVISLVANTDMWRRILIGGWFVALYTGLWYMASDLLANGRLRRETLADALLMTGAVALIVGFVQLRVWAVETLPAILNGTVPFSLPRPVSVMGNANTLSAFLVVLLPFAVGRALLIRGRFNRLVMSLYALLALLLLALTFSRGAWLGALAGAATVALLVLHRRSALSSNYWRGWWAKQTAARRGLVVVAAAAVVVVALAGAFLFARTFTIGGRTLDLRTGIFNAAVRLFAEQPLTGHGLFTFGSGLSRYWSTPPEQTHAHAHNIPLQAAAELGIPGLAALAASIFLIARGMWRNWRAATGRERGTLLAAIAACAGFGVHHLTDMPAMMPAVALTGLLALVVAVAPLQSVPLAQGAGRLRALALVAGWSVILAAGIWSAGIYSRYVDTLAYGATSGDYRGAAERLEATISADPALAITYQQQGLLYGLAAYAGDDEAVRLGADAYRRFVSFEPNYAVGWANLAALEWQSGDPEAAVDAMRRAADLAPESWQLAFRLGAYAEAAGDPALAGQAYRRALALFPNATLLLELDGTPLRQELANPIALTNAARLVWLLENDTADAARAYRDAAPQLNTGSAQSIVLDALILLEEGDETAALARLDEAAALATSNPARAWALLGRARYALARGDDAEAGRSLQAARELMTPPLLARDEAYGANIAYIQFLRQGFERQFLPQVGYETTDPLFLYLLERTAASAHP